MIRGSVYIDFTLFEFKVFLISSILFQLFRIERFRAQGIRG